MNTKIINENNKNENRCQWTIQIVSKSEYMCFKVLLITVSVQKGQGK